MLIKSLILRDKGTTVKFGPWDRPDAVYLFRGEKKGPHVCDVDNEEHSRMLLSQRPKVFALVTDPIDEPEAPDPDEPENLEMVDDDVLEGEVDDEGKPVEPITGEEASKEALRAARAAYREKFKKNPGPSWDVEEIARRLDAE